MQKPIVVKWVNHDGSDVVTCFATEYGAIRFEECLLAAGLAYQRQPRLAAATEQPQHSQT